MDWILENWNSEENYQIRKGILSMSLVILVLAMLSVIFRFIHSYWKFYTIIRKIPGPKRHPLWGSLDKYMPNEDGIRNMEQYISNNPDIRFMHLSVGPFIHAVRFHYPEEIAELLCKKPRELPKNQMLYGILRQFIGDGLLVSNNDKWQYRRKLLTAGFHYDILLPYVSIYNDTVEVFIDKCNQQIEHRHNSIEIFDTFTLLTLDNMLKCVCSYESGDNDAYISAIKMNTELARKQAIFLPYQIKPIFFFSLDGARWRKNCRIVQQHALKVISHRREYILSNHNNIGGKECKDFIDILLTAKDSEGNGLTDQDIVEEMTTFIFRGHDTTGAGISWTLYLLAAHPNYQQMCRKEIQDIVCDRKSNRIQWDDLPRLSLLTMCIKESLRLYPPVHDIFRTNTEDMVINGYLIPKGTIIDIAIANMHRNPHVWKDPHEFNPMRFDCDLPGDHPFAFIPFSGGHRNCIGQKFALNEQLVTIARIINQYNLGLLTKEIRRMPGIVFKPEEDIRIKFSRVMY